MRAQEPERSAQESERPEPVSDRRARALTRLTELADEPGGEQFLARTGAPGASIVDHRRPVRGEIEETILQTTPYAGIPGAVNAMKVLREEQEAQT